MKFIRGNFGCDGVIYHEPFFAQFLGKGLAEAFGGGGVEEIRFLMYSTLGISSIKGTFPFKS